MEVARPFDACDAPWACFAPLHRGNHVLGSAIVLRVRRQHLNHTCEKGAICLVFQSSNEIFSPADAVVAKFRSLRSESMVEGGDPFARFLASHHFVLVLVAYGEGGGLAFSPTEEESWCLEVCVSHDDIRTFCPTVAYSGCDTWMCRVAQTVS